MKDPLGDAPPVDSRRAILGVSVAIALFVVLIFVRPSMAMTVAIAIGLIFTIMLHEAGHLIAAKRGGMKATEFFVGFGPRLWSFRRGETEYGIKAIPAGGYVRVIGMTNLEEVEPEDEARTYRAAPYKRKMVMILAGVTVNLLLAYLFTFAILVGRGQDSVSTRIGSVSAESPAQIAGVKPGDRLLSIGGVEISDWDEVSPLVRAAAYVGPDRRRRADPRPDRSAGRQRGWWRRDRPPGAASSPASGRWRRYRRAGCRAPSGQSRARIGGAGQRSPAASRSRHPVRSPARERPAGPPDPRDRRSRPSPRGQTGRAR